MNSLNAELRQALTDFMAASGSRDSAKIAFALKRIIALQQSLPADVDPMLRHYLERRSYQKALDFLNSSST